MIVKTDGLFAALVSTASVTAANKLPVQSHTKNIITVNHLHHSRSQCSVIPHSDSRKQLVFHLFQIKCEESP